GTAEDSESFSPLLTGQSILSHRASMVHQSSRGLFGYREGDWKYIDGLGSGGFTPPATVEPGADGATGQLYNLANDPRESKNQFAQEPNRVKAMKRALAKEVE